MTEQGSALTGAADAGPRAHRAQAIFVGGDGWDEPRTWRLRCVYCDSRVQGRRFLGRVILGRWRHVS